MGYVSPEDIHEDCIIDLENARRIAGDNADEWGKAMGEIEALRDTKSTLLTALESARDYLRDEIMTGDDEVNFRTTLGEIESVIAIARA